MSRRKNCKVRSWPLVLLPDLSLLSSQCQVWSETDHAQMQQDCFSTLCQQMTTVSILFLYEYELRSWFVWFRHFAAHGAKAQETLDTETLQSPSSGLEAPSNFFATRRWKTRWKNAGGIFLHLYIYIYIFICVFVYIYIMYIYIIQRKFRSQTSDSMDRWEAAMGRAREKRRVEERRAEKREESEERRCRCVGKSRKTVFFQWFVAPEGRKVGLLKRRVRSQLAR